MGCKKLKTVHLPSTLTALGDNAFLRCASLGSIALPATLQSIGSGVFKKCHHLTAVNIPKGVRSIGPHAFEGCTSLKVVRVPKFVESIGEGAFEGCSELSLETASLGSIGHGAFTGTTRVTFVSTNLKMASLRGPAAHAFGTTAPKPTVQVRVPAVVENGAARQIVLFKKFLSADTPQTLVLNFYKLRVSLGLDATVKEPVGKRYETLRHKLLPLCGDFDAGADLFSKGADLLSALDDKVKSMDQRRQAQVRCPVGLSVCVVGGGPVGIRCAIELVLLGQEVTVLERFTTIEVPRRPDVPQVVRWAAEDLLSLGSTPPRAKSRSSSNAPRVRSRSSSSQPRRQFQSNAPGTLRTAMLEVDLMRTALVLGVKFIFGSSVIKVEASGGGRMQHSINVDFSRGLKATMA
jgi:hypothetical protein